MSHHVNDPAADPVSGCPATPGEPPPGCAHAEPPAIRPVFWRVALYLVVYLFSQIAGSMMAAGAVTIFEQGESDLAWGEFLERHLILISLGGTILGILVSLVFWKRVDRRGLASLGLPRHPGVPGEAARGFLAAVWLMTLTSIPSFITAGGNVRFLPGGMGWFVAGLVPYVLVFVLVALNEELAFRGYLFRNLLLRVKPWIAVLVSSVLFAAMHVFNPNLTFLALLNLHLAGLLLALSVLRWGSLWYAIAFHFAWNSWQALVLAQPVSGVRVHGLLEITSLGPGWLTGGDFGPEGSAVTTLLLLIASARMATGLPVELSRSPVDPPCTKGEICPLIPEEIVRAAERGSLRHG